MTTPAADAGSPRSEQGFHLRKAAFVLWAFAFVPLYPFIRLISNAPPIQRSVIGALVFGASAVAALWFLGRELRPVLRNWRVAFLAWAMVVLPVQLTAVEGIASEGWPKGEHNKVVAELLILVLVLTVPAFLTSLLGLLRTYRLASGVALLTGFAYLVNGVLLVRATAPSKGWWFDLGSVLNIILTGAKMGSYLSIPVGVVFIIGAVMVFRATRPEAASAARSAI